MAPKLSTSNRRIPVSELTPEAFASFGEVVQNPATHDAQPASLRSTEANQGTATKWTDVTRMRNWYELSSSRKAAEIKMNMFVCRPRQLEADQMFRVKVLERHPFTPQTFVPMGLDRVDRGTGYLVIVAPTLPLKSRTELADGVLEPAYPIPPPRRKRSIRERLLGARPNPFTNDFTSSTTPLFLAPTETRPKGPGLPDLDNLRAFIARGDQAVTYGAGTWHAPMVVLGKKPIEFVVVQYMNGVAIEDCQEVEVQGVSGGESGLEVSVGGMLNPATLQAKL